MMNRFYLLILTLGLFTSSLVGQTNVYPSAALEINSTNKGFLPPRLTEAQRDAISHPAMGLLIYNLETFTLNVYSGVSWVQLGTMINGVNPITSSTGKVWMDRNLGASRVASSSTDSDAYGDFYQWGRNRDGHEKRTSGVIAGTVNAGNEGNTFVTAQQFQFYNWLSSIDDTRWAGTTKGPHDPCPSGFRVPTSAEWSAEVTSHNISNAATAFASPLRLTSAGYRSVTDASINSAGDRGYYWSSTPSGSSAFCLEFNSTSANVNVNFRGHGFSVRCIEE